MPIYRGPNGKFASPPKAAIAEPELKLEATSQPQVEQTTKAYKGFNRNHDGSLYCRNHYFQPGRRDTIPKSPYRSSPELCRHGFHACMNLWDVFNFYDFSAGRAFAEVTLHGKTEKDNQKIVAFSITPEAPMHPAHLINRLAFEVTQARETDPRAFSHVNLNFSKFDTNRHTWDIQTSAARFDTREQTTGAGYGVTHQLTTRAEVHQIHLARYGGQQIAAADNCRQYATYANQVMAGNFGQTVFQGNNGRIEVLGKNCTVTVLGKAEIKATEGTKITVVSLDQTVIQKTIQADMANQWLQLRDITPPSPRVYDLAPYKS